MDDPSIQAIVIATPAKTHFELVLQALQSGKHVLVEKPMAMTIAEVEQIEALAQQSNLIAMVGHTFLYNSAVRYLKKLIDSGELGELRYIYSQRLNLGRIRSDVDVLWNLAPHDVSIIHYLLDDPSPVAVVKNGMDYVQQGIADVVFLHIQYPQKVMAHIHVSWLDPHKVRRMIVVGSKKMVVYDDVGDNKIAIYDKGIDPVAVLGDNMDFDELNFREISPIAPVMCYGLKLTFKNAKVEIAHFIDLHSRRHAMFEWP
jgi:predicted dehydrogenase